MEQDMYHHFLAQERLEAENRALFKNVSKIVGRCMREFGIHVEDAVVEELVDDVIRYFRIDLLRGAL